MHGRGHRVACTLWYVSRVFGLRVRHPDVVRVHPKKNKNKFSKNKGAWGWCG